MNNSNIQIFRSKDGGPEIDVRLENETVWLNQYQIEELFQTNRTSINKHILKIYKTGELEENSTCAFFAQVQCEGKRNIKRNIKYYNLDVIIAVGYRVNSTKATKFRQWASNVLKEYIKKGFVLDDERLKQGERVFGKDYFKELLERVHSIRASERRI